MAADWVREGGTGSNVIVAYKFHRTATHKWLNAAAHLPGLGIKTPRILSEGLTNAGMAHLPCGLYSSMPEVHLAMIGASPRSKVNLPIDLQGSVS